MENASKALVIAGGVLIGLLLLVLLVYTFRQWGDAEATKQKELESQRVGDFNKSYLSYEKQALYGSELLGLVNKMRDYNVSDDIKYNGFEKMSLKVKINGGTGDLFENNGTYDLEDIYDRIYNTSKSTSIISIKNRFSNITDPQWETLAKASSDDQTFQKLCTPQGLNITYSPELQEAAKEYYKYIQFKRKEFRHVDTSFFSNGRVDTMKFEEK